MVLCGAYLLPGTWYNINTRYHVLHIADSAPKSADLFLSRSESGRRRSRFSIVYYNISLPTRCLTTFGCQVLAYRYNILVLGRSSISAKMIPGNDKSNTTRGAFRSHPRVSNLEFCVGERLGLAYAVVDIIFPDPDHDYGEIQESPPGFQALRFGLLKE